MEVLPNLVGLAGYPCSTVPDLVRAIVDVYAACATIESVAAPLIQFGRRFIGEINTPSGRILIVPRKGPIGAGSDMGAGHIAGILPMIHVYLWSAEPTQTSDELADELTRSDLAAAMVARFLNVLNHVAVGRYQPADLDPDAGNSDPASVNEYGEAHLLTFRFAQDIVRDGTVFSVVPTLGTDGLPTPRISPPPNYASAGGILTDLALTVTPKG